MSNLPLYAKNVLKTAPSVEPVTTAEAKEHLRVYTDDDDTYIDGLILAARNWAEDDTGRALITQTWTRYLNDWPGGNCIDLPFGSLQSVASVKYQDADDAQQTLSSDDYIVSTSETIGKIVLKSDEDWPTLRDDLVDAVQIEFTAGYGDAATDVPQIIRNAMLLMIGHWYENRESTIAGMSINEVPMSTNAMLSKYRLDLV